MSRQNAADAIETEDAKVLAALTEQRGATYGFLSRLYLKEIDEELLDEMHGMLYPTETGNEDVDEGYMLIATYLSNLWADSVTELSIDYTRCFIGNGVDTFSAAYPYESVYTGQKRLLMQSARDEVLAVYRAYGMEKAADWKGSEDHIALELEFMQVLCNRCAKALNAGDEKAAVELLKAQRNFLDDRLCAWVGMMTKDMRRFAETKLYLGLAQLTDGFLETDLSLLNELLAGQPDDSGKAGKR